MRRPALPILLVAVAALLCLPAAASAASVKVIDLNGAAHELDLGANASEQDIVDTEYAIRSGSGTSPRTVSGFSLDQVFKLAGVDRYSYNYLEVGGAVELTNQQVRESGSPDGPPVVYEDGDSVGFIRPSAGAGDNNASDSFSTPGQLVIKLEDGSPIDISVTASDAEVEVGEQVDFAADVEHPGTIDPEIRWNFRDGPSVAGGESISHEFKSAGTYEVVVTATDPDNGQGPGASVEIQVGEKKEGKPDRKGGGEDHDENAPDTGSSEGTGGSEGGTTTGPGTGPVTPAAPPVVAPEVPEEPREPDKPQPDVANGEEVSGELLQDAIVVTPEPEKKPEKTKAQTARTGTEAGDGFGIPGAALGGMSVFALLGLGALGQAGRIRPDSMLWHANRLIGR